MACSGQCGGHRIKFNVVADFAAELPAQEPTPESIARPRVNQVFVKVIVPVTVAIMNRLVATGH